jgi:hypothetical protein
MSKAVLRIRRNADQALAEMGKPWELIDFARRASWRGWGSRPVTIVNI